MTRRGPGLSPFRHTGHGSVVHTAGSTARPQSRGVPDGRRRSAAGHHAGEDAQGPHPPALHRRHPGGGARRPGGRLLPRPRRRPEAARRGLRQPHQDDDLAGHLLHHRAGHRLGAAGGPGRPRRRPGARLLHHDVDVRPRDRARRRQPRAAGILTAGRRRLRGAARAGGRHDRLPARPHPDHAGVPARRGVGALDAARRAAHRLRGPGARGHRPAGRRCAAWPCSWAPST